MKQTVKMRTKKPTYTITIQNNQFASPPKVLFRVTPAKTEKILDMLQPERKRGIKETKCSSVTLDMFFTD